MNRNGSKHTCSKYLFQLNPEKNGKCKMENGKCKIKTNKNGEKQL